MSIFSALYDIKGAGSNEKVYYVFSYLSERNVVAMCIN